MPKRKPMKIQPNDRIAYSASFLKSIGAGHDIASIRGTFVGNRTIGSRELCQVLWDGDDEPKLVGRHAIAKVGPNSEFTNVE